MRITIKNVDETGRIAMVISEERMASEHDWKLRDKVYLGKGQQGLFHLHAALRLTIVEDPSITIPA